MAAPKRLDLRGEEARTRPLKRSKVLSVASNKLGSCARVLLEPLLRCIPVASVVDLAGPWPDGRPTNRTTGLSKLA